MDPNSEFDASHFLTAKNYTILAYFCYALSFFTPVLLGRHSYDWSGVSFILFSKGRANLACTTVEILMYMIFSLDDGYKAYIKSPNLSMSAPLIKSLNWWSLVRFRAVAWISLACLMFCFRFLKKEELCIFLSILLAIVPVAAVLYRYRLSLEALAMSHYFHETTLKRVKVKRPFTHQTQLLVVSVLWLCEAIFASMASKKVSWWSYAFVSNVQVALSLVELPMLLLEHETMIRRASRVGKILWGYSFPMAINDGL